MQRKPHKVDVSLDSDIDLVELTETVTTQLITAYFLIKGFKTLCSAFEHVVVTKVK